jgi:hypothetical protein
MEDASEVLPPMTAMCVHHWVLGMPASGVTSGTCRDCGELREFTDQRAAPLSLGRGRRGWR